MSPQELREENARLRKELRNIAEAKRFDRSVFETDTDFADWAQSRCRYQIRGDAAADVHVKTAAEMRYDAAHDTSCVGAFARARP